MQMPLAQNISLGRHNSSLPSFNCRAFLLLACLVGVVYSNSLHNSWHLDDFHSIINNPKLHLVELTPTSLSKTFQATSANGYYNSDSLYRPFPNLTFSLNWLIGQDDVTGYHIVNIIIHILTSFVLLLTIQLLLLTPNCRTADKLYSFIPLFTAVLWAINPIQVSAVTYIVQRMAMCVTFFTISSIFFYLKARLSSSQKYCIINSVACFVSFLLAFGSKENAILLPFSLVLIEFLFFQDLNSSKIKKLLWWVAGGVALAIVALVSIYMLRIGFLSHFINYSSRPFSLIERLLTESRVVVLYLSLMFYPLAEHFSIQHDIGLSTSLLSPPSTLFAILFIAVLIFIAFHQSTKRPLISFAILFYFVNHLIESTIIPLELTFEHRNYLPSLFVFLPISLVSFGVLEQFRHKKITRSFIVVFFSLILAMIALGTYSRNEVWQTEESLWQDVTDKYPDIFRANITLAQIAGDKGNIDEAMILLERSLALSSTAQSPRIAKAKVLSEIARYHYKKGEFNEAITLCLEVLQAIPRYDIARRPLINSYIANGDWTAADLVVNEVLERRPAVAYFLKAKGFILLKQEQSREAIPFLVKAGSVDSADWQIPMFIGVSLDKIGKHQQALWFLQKARKLSANNQIPLMGLIQNRMVADKQSANKYVKILLAEFTTTEIKGILKESKINNLLPPLQTEKISKAIAAELQDKIVDFL